MTAEKIMYINGKCLNQTEEVIPQPSEQDFGIAATGCELHIRSKLQYITRDVTSITVWWSYECYMLANKHSACRSILSLTTFHPKFNITHDSLSQLQ